MIIDIIQFIKEGRMGDLSIGIRKSNVLLEEPIDVYRNRKTEIHRYGSLQVAFSSGKIVLLGVYFDCEAPHCKAVQLLNTEKFALKSSDDVFQILSAEHIAFQIEENLTNERQTCCLTESGVRILFDNELKRCVSLQKSEPSN